MIRPIPAVKSSKRRFPFQLSCDPLYPGAVCQKAPLGVPGPPGSAHVLASTNLPYVPQGKGEGGRITLRSGQRPVQRHGFGQVALQRLARIELGPW